MVYVGISRINDYLKGEDMLRKSEELNRINDYDFNRIVESFDNYSEIMQLKERNSLMPRSYTN